MKISLFLSLCALVVSHTSADSRPGFCENDDDCQKQSPNYACVSVQTTRTGAEEVKQCVPRNPDGSGVCAGIEPGLCPTFTLWPKEYKPISSVCAYITPPNRCLKDNAVSEKGKVACLKIEDENGDETGVVYGCVDYDGSRLMFIKGDKMDKFAQTQDYNSIINDNCINPKNPTGSVYVCSGRGTCAPRAAGNLDYSCQCNIGYSGKYCQKIDNNKCASPGQCDAGECNLVTQQCECSKGTTGPKCAECDPSSADACSKKGKCVPQSSARTLLTLANSDTGSTVGTVSVGEDKPTSSKPKSTKAPAADGSSGSEEEMEESGEDSISSGLSGPVCKCDKGWEGSNCATKVILPKEKKPKSTPSDSSTNAAATSSFQFTVFATTVLIFFIALN
jgi:hypothetical protein